MTEPILLQIGNVTERMKNRFDALFDVHVWFDQQDQDAFVDTHGALVVGISTDGHWGVPDNLLARLPNLKVVSSYGVGYDAIDANDAAARGILVSHTPNVLNDEVADTAIMLWLATSRRLVQADKWARSGQWERDGAFPLTRSVQNRQIGILGMGRIGETIAKRASGFDATIHYHSRTPKDVNYIYHSTVKELADAVDVLFVITPGGASTYHLVNDEVMNALGAEGMLINVARGSVVDETALIAALQDVFAVTIGAFHEALGLGDLQPDARMAQCAFAAVTGDFRRFNDFGFRCFKRHSSNPSNVGRCNAYGRSNGVGQEGNIDPIRPANFNLMSL